MQYEIFKIFFVVFDTGFFIYAYLFCRLYEFLPIGSIRPATAISISFAWYHIAQIIIHDTKKFATDLGYLSLSMFNITAADGFITSAAVSTFHNGYVLYTRKTNTIILKIVSYQFFTQRYCSPVTGLNDAITPYVPV